LIDFFGNGGGFVQSAVPDQRAPFTIIFFKAAQILTPATEAIPMQLAKLWNVFIAFILALMGLWLVGVEAGGFTGDFWLTRKTLVLGTGVLAFGLMSAAVILAARPVWFETALGGLDKFYRLHKWLGISAFAFATFHWILRMGPSWITSLDLYDLPARATRTPDTTPGFNIFRDLRHAAAEVGEWAFYILAALVVIALWKRFPYKYFFMTHKLMAVVYLLVVFHTFILTDLSYWTQPIGPVLAVLMALGTAAALVSLFQKIGYRRRSSGKISQILLHDDREILEVTVQLDTAWPGHDAGQFAFVNFDDVEAAHPFTISSAWQNDGCLTFTIKAMGDYTKTLADSLVVGQSAVVEGPYGRFNFQGTRSRQIWIGGGVGITPFIAGLDALPSQVRASDIDLFYSVRKSDPAYTSRIRRFAEQAGVRLHVFEEGHEGLLTLDRIEALVPEWQQADIWFCGPSQFGGALLQPMLERGLPPAQFHQELFEMR
jgi:predicted ferric reductase